MPNDGNGAATILQACIVKPAFAKLRAEWEKVHLPSKEINYRDVQIGIVSCVIYCQGTVVEYPIEVESIRIHQPVLLSSSQRHHLVCYQTLQILLAK